MPFPCESTFTINDSSVDSCARSITETLLSLDVKFRYRPILAIGLGFATGNVWSRAARRRKQQLRHDSTHNVASDNESDDDEPAFGFKIQLNSSEKGSVEVLVRWIQGRDSVLFESFCGMLKRELTKA